MAAPAGAAADDALDEEMFDDDALDVDVLDDAALEEDDDAETTPVDDDPAAIAWGEEVPPPLPEPPQPLIVTLKAMAARDRSRAGRYALFMGTQLNNEIGGHDGR